jgi:hypothetical protein
VAALKKLCTASDRLKVLKKRLKGETREGNKP